MPTEPGAGQAAAEGIPQPAADSEPEVFETVLPITIFVLSDEDFLQDDDKDREVSIPEVEQEFKLNNGLCLKNEVQLSNDRISVGDWDANKTLSNEDNYIKYFEDKSFAKSVCNTSKLSLSDGYDADTDKCGQNCMLPALTCKIELPEIMKYSDGEDCGDNDGFQKMPPLFSADRADTFETLVVVPKHEEEPVSIAGDLFDGSPQKQSEICKDFEIIVKMEGLNSDKCGQNCMLPSSSCKTELPEIMKYSDGEDHGDNDGFQKIPPLFSSADRADTFETLVLVPKHEEPVNIASVPFDGSPQKQSEICKDLEIIVKMEGLNSDKCGQNCMLPSSCKTELPEMMKYSDGEDCGDNDGFQKMPPLFSSADSDRADTFEALVLVPKHEEEPVSIASVPFDGSPQKQSEICKDLEIIVKTEGLNSDKCGQNCMLPSSCKTELTEMMKYSDGEDCGDNDGFQKIPPLLSSADSDRADTFEALVLVPKHEEEPVSIASVPFDGSPQDQPEIHKDLEIIVKMEGPDSSENGGHEIDCKKISKFEDETLSSLLEHGLKEEEKYTYNCSDPFLNGCSPTFRENLEDVGKTDMNASTSESNTTGEHIYKILTPFSKKRYRQQKIVSSHASPKEFQSQQESLTWLNDSVTITPLPKTSCFKKENERSSFKCRFCSSVYKCSAHLKKHIYSAHKDKKTHKCCFCKRTFFFSLNLKNHLKFHKKIARLQKARKNRISARKGRQKGSEEGASETKKKESKYKNFFIKIERDFTPLDVPISFSCRICFYASSNPRSFVHHVKGHKERPPYQCPQCDYCCSSLSYLLNHMYWHAGYKLYQCRFCTFFSLYFASMVRHSHIHTGDKPYSCELCQAAFTSTSGLERHRRIHAGKETCQGQQPNCLSGRKRTERPPKNYTCGECNLVFFTKGHLSFHKKCHERLKADGYTSWSNKYCKSKVGKADGDSQGRVSHSLFGRENDCLDGGILASEVKFEQACDVWDNKKIRCGKKFFENSQGSNSLAVTGDRSEVPQTSYQMDTVTYKEEPFFKSEASHSQVQDDASFHNFVENPEDTYPCNLNTFQTYRCQHCSYVTSVSNNFRLHLKIHTDERPFVCKECNEAFKTSNHLQKHSLLHVKNGQEFGSCLFVERCLENLELHREIHGGTYPERDFGFYKGSNSSLLGSEVCGLQQGVQRGTANNVQAQNQPLLYQCAECSYATGILSNLELHIRTHTGVRPYSCTVCQKKFRTSSHLKRHRLTHLNTGHFKCMSCDYSTNKWLSLKQHLASHAGEGTSSPGCLFEHKEPPVKTYRCEECGYCTARSGNLKLHLRTHTGEKPYQCGQCSLAFRTSSHLKRHLLTHLKLQCRRCRYSTMDKQAFQKHIKMHKKKYRCGKCNVVLPTKKLLEKHKQQHMVGM